MFNWKLILSICLVGVAFIACRDAEAAPSVVMVDTTNPADMSSTTSVTTSPEDDESLGELFEEFVEELEGLDEEEAEDNEYPVIVYDDQYKGIEYYPDGTYEVFGVENIEELLKIMEEDRDSAAAECSDLKELQNEQTGNVDRRLELEIEICERDVALIQLDIDDAMAAQAKAAAKAAQP